MIGKTLAHYEIKSLLGKGGMGEVYRARDTKLDRDVALKILPPEATQDPERRKRFETEAKAVAALNHPNIVTIHSVEDAAETHFITMELVKGQTLTDLVPKSGLSLPRMLDIAILLADAVSAAHRAGITHRDLKPENIMVDDEGRLKVLDFGLAKLKDPLPAADQATRVQSEIGVTQEGKVLGTVAYMSPEQAEGKAVDARSDVFSLGTVLYEMSTGQRPFDGDTPVSTVTSILRDEPVSVTDLNAAMPRQLGRVLKRCLAKEPDRRYESALGVRNDLQELKAELDSGELTVPIVPAKARAGGGLRWVVLGVVLAGGIWGVTRYVGWPSTGSDDPAPFESMEFTPLTTDGTSTDATISADGRYVAHVEVENGKSTLWITQVSTKSRVEIVPATEDQIWGPEFSPDGDLLYYRQGARFWLNEPLFRRPSLGGAARKLPIDCVRFGISPDGERIAYSARQAGTFALVQKSGQIGKLQMTRLTARPPERQQSRTIAPLRRMRRD